VSAADLQDAQATEDRSDCEVDRGACSKHVGSHEVIFEITPKPVKTMRELGFVVMISGLTGKGELRVDLRMPGMYMGKNQILLKGDGTGRYTGKGIIPRCPSGGRLWEAKVNIPGTGTAEFLFNVTY
jgi:hypothetical protein